MPNSENTAKGAWPPRDLASLPKEFVEICSESLWWIRVCLENAWRNWGTKDFPSDKGISFRNSLYKYTYSYFDCVFESVHPNYKARHPEVQDEKWLKNRDVVLRLGKQHLIRMAGLSHFYVHGRSMFMVIEEAKRNSIANPASGPPAIKYVHSSLDWMTAMYGFPTSIPVSWNKMLFGDLDFSAYMRKSNDFMYSELAYSLALDPYDVENKGAWGGLALEADFLAYRTNDATWTPYCNEQFALITAEAEQRRSQK